MSKVLFVHDGPMYINEEGKYFAFAYDNNLKNRYLQLGEKLTFLMRTQKVLDTNFSEINNGNLLVIDVPNFKSPKLYFQNFKKASQIIEQQVKEHDKIIIRLPSSNGNLAVQYAKKYKKKYMIEVVGCPWDAYWNYSIQGKVVAPIEYYKMKKLVKKSPYTLYVTNNFLQKRYPTNGISVNCSNVILDDVSEKKLYKKIENYQKTSTKSIVLGTAAAIDVKYKGQDDVIRAISLLKKKGYDIKYQLVGGGSIEYLRTIAKKYDVEDNIAFLGKKSHKEVLEWMENITIYIQPSKQEGLPRALIEAMSVACFCIGSNTAGIPELLDSNYIFKKGKYIEISKIIESLNERILVEQSVKNQKTAKEYLLTSLNNRRNSFYKKTGFLEGLQE